MFVVVVQSVAILKQKNSTHKKGRNDVTEKLELEISYSHGLFVNLGNRTIGVHKIDALSDSDSGGRKSSTEERKKNNIKYSNTDRSSTID